MLFRGVRSRAASLEGAAIGARAGCAGCAAPPLMMMRPARNAFHVAAYLARLALKTMKWSSASLPRLRLWFRGGRTWRSPRLPSAWAR
eukprot:1159048-Pyramimonas_sp.AAC.1